MLCCSQGTTDTESLERRILRNEFLCKREILYKTSGGFLNGDLRMHSGHFYEREARKAPTSQDRVPQEKKSIPQDGKAASLTEGQEEKLQSFSRLRVARCCSYGTTPDGNSQIRRLRTNVR